MIQVTEDSYLGDIISGDGKNTKTIEKRISKGLGIISEIMNILEKVTLGEFYFPTALLLRESMFLNGILTNAEIWYGISKAEIKELEDLDSSLLRKILKTKCSVPAEALYLELGCLNISTILKARRLNYLHYLVNRDEKEMLHKFFYAQWNHPTPNDWTIQARQDLTDFGLEVDLNLIKDRSKWSFKNLIKIKAKEYALYNFLEKKENHSKLSNLVYTDLKLQEYMKELTTSQAQTVFAYRSRMAQYSENYRGGQGHLPCPLCLMHLDCQSMSFNCPSVKENIKIQGKYENIFCDKIEPELAETLVKIDKYRKTYIESRKVE